MGFHGVYMPIKINTGFQFTKGFREETVKTTHSILIGIWLGIMVYSWQNHGI